MITAEMQRILLLVALAATAYLMVLAWNNDYIKGRAVPGESASPIAAAPVGDAPDSFSEVRDESQTIVDVPKEESHPNDSVPSPDASSRLVKVTTEAMEVWIDRLGGDIVRVRLPRYPVSIEKPNQAFLLMDRRSDHVYIAQSGLAGRDGPDGTGRRPLYESEKANSISERRRNAIDRRREWRRNRQGLYIHTGRLCR